MTAATTSAPVLTDVTDACAFHDWPGTKALTPYMPPGWRELIERPSDPMGAANIRVGAKYKDPRGAFAEGTYPETGKPGTSFELFSEQVLSDPALSNVVLGYDEALLVTTLPNHYLAQEVAKAVNHWNEEEWLARDPRLHGYIFISTSVPEDAAKEVRRAARNDRFVGVHMGVNSLGKAFGHPIYHPIYEAAAELGLPIVIQFGSDGNAPDQFALTPGGPVATYGEFRATMDRVGLASHMISMIAQGVFEKFKDLKLLLIGGGIAWVPDALWRSDTRIKSVIQEIPWVKRTFEEYFLDHVRMTTYGLEVPSEHLGAVMGSVPGFESTLVYASGYPNRDWTTPADAAAALGTFASDAVFNSAATDLFRFGGVAKED